MAVGGRPISEHGSSPLSTCGPRAETLDVLSDMERGMKLDVECSLPVGTKVVIVEDDLTLRELLESILVEFGATCTAFDNAEDALVYLIEQKCACTLMIVDHGVPGSIKGMEFISMVHEKWPGIPAILTSGYQLDTTGLAPPVSYLFKPWSVEELVVSIREVIKNLSDESAQIRR